MGTVYLMFGDHEYLLVTVVLLEYYCRGLEV